MFQIKNAQVSLRVNNDEKESLNTMIAEIQQNHNVTFTSVKHMFQSLVSMAANNVNTEPETVEVVKTPEFACILHENKEQEEEFKAALDDIRKLDNLSTEDISSLSDVSVIKMAVYGVPTYVNKMHSDSKIITELQSKEPEIKVEYKEKPIENNQVFLTFNEKDSLILKTIAENRRKRFKKEKAETLSEMTYKMIMNDNVLFDLGGEFYTGLSGLFKK